MSEEIHITSKAEQSLGEGERLLRLIADALPVLILYVDAGQYYRFVNRGYTEWFGLKPEEVIGRHMRDVLGEAAYEAIRPEVEKALAGQEVVFERLMPYHASAERYIHVNYVPDCDAATGTVRGFCALVQDVSESKREELDRQFLLELGEKIRYGEIDAGAFLDDVTESASKHLNVARCLFIEINEAENRGTILHEYCRPGVESVAGVYKISDYSPATLAEIKSGRTIINHDSQHDPRTASIYEKTYEPYDERAYVSVPLFTEGVWTAIFWMSDDRPRVWTGQEVAFLETVGERAWLAVEKLRNEEALKQNRERLQMAMEAANIYSWEMNLATQRLERSSNMERVLGFALPPAFADVLKTVHPEDRERVLQTSDRAVRTGESASTEVRLIHPRTGEVVWVMWQGIAVSESVDDEPRLVGITQNITERKRAESEREELLQREQATRREAEEASRLKDEFLATISHELRTPLTAILGWAHMLRSGEVNESSRATALEIIYRNAKSQAQLIEDILDVSRIITGKIRIDARPISLAPIIQRAVESLRPAIEAKSIALRMHLNFEPRLVLADPDRMQQVVWNLLSNAVKFTPERGEVSVQLETDAAQTKIVVTDSGEGINQDFLPFVFERFRQADGSTTRNHGGLGLGLAIVRHIVELHGGTVEARSEGRDRGASFTVQLPLLKTDNMDGKGAESWQSLHASTRLAPSLVDAGRIKGLRVLLVDDEKDTLDLLASVLSQSEAEVKQAPGVRGALEVLREWKPDVIVCDIAMPEEDGFAFIKKLRALPIDAGGATPVIALTAYVGIKERMQVLSSGFQMYVPKPVEPAELLGALMNFMPKP